MLSCGARSTLPLPYLNRTQSTEGQNEYITRLADSLTHKNSGVHRPAGVVRWSLTTSPWLAGVPFPSLPFSVFHFPAMLLASRAATTNEELQLMMMMMMMMMTMMMMMIIKY